MRTSVVTFVVQALLMGCQSEPRPPVDAEPTSITMEPAASEVGTLGSRRSQTCTTVMAEFASLRNEREPAGALSSFALGYRAPDSAVAGWVRATDKALARVGDDGQPIDHVELTVALEGASGEQPVAERARIDAVQILNRVSLLAMRRHFERVAKAGTPDGPALDDVDLVAEWDEAWCLWDGALRPLAQAVDEDGGEGWEELIVQAFTVGRAALVENDDPGRVRSNREVAEKGTYAVVQRLVLARAAAAKLANDARVARVARGLLGIIEDRISDRNGPGLARVVAMLKGPPTEIDVQSIERELGKAFAKRARKYCDEAVVAHQLGTPDGIKGAWEGMVYTRLLLPDMLEVLGPQGFEADEHVADWESYIEAVGEGDGSEAAALSARLVEWNCAYQQSLGIAECSATGNEAE